MKSSNACMNQDSIRAFQGQNNGIIDPDQSPIPAEPASMAIPQAPNTNQNSVKSSQNLQSLGGMGGIASGQTTQGVGVMGAIMTNCIGEGLMQDTFTQKSQSLRHQMQIVNDKLFETDKLLSMQNYLIKQNSSVSKNPVVDSNLSPPKYMNKSSGAYRARRPITSACEASGMSRGSIIQSNSDRNDNGSAILGPEQIGSLYGNAFVDRANVIHADPSQAQFPQYSEERKNWIMFSDRNSGQIIKTRKISEKSKHDSPFKANCRSSTVTAKQRSSPRKINQENWDPASARNQSLNTVDRDQNRIISGRHFRSYSNMSGRQNCHTEKVSVTKNVADPNHCDLRQQHSDFRIATRGDCKMLEENKEMSNKKMTQKRCEDDGHDAVQYFIYSNQTVPTHENQEHGHLRVEQPQCSQWQGIAGQLNDNSATRRAGIQINQNTFGRYASKPDYIINIESSYGLNSSNNEVLNTIMNLNTEQSDTIKLNQDFQIVDHAAYSLPRQTNLMGGSAKMPNSIQTIIQENSLENSNSKQNSNQTNQQSLLEDTKQINKNSSSNEEEIISKGKNGSNMKSLNQKNKNKLQEQQRDKDDAKLNGKLNKEEQIQNQNCKAQNGINLKSGSVEQLNTNPQYMYQHYESTKSYQDIRGLANDNENMNSAPNLQLIALRNPQAYPNIKIPSSSLQTTNNNSRKSMLLDHKKIDQISEGKAANIPEAASNANNDVSDKNNLSSNIDAYQNISNNQSSKENLQIFNSKRHLIMGEPITDISISSRTKNVETYMSRRSQNTPNNQIPLIRDRSSNSNLTDNGKSEPICSDMETQRQTVITNVRQFNQERMNDMNQLAAQANLDRNLDPYKQMTSNSINQMGKLQAQDAMRTALAKFLDQNNQDSSGVDDRNAQYFNNFSYFKSGRQQANNPYDEHNNNDGLELNGINETCFFKNQKEGGNHASATRGINHTAQPQNKISNFENTKSHDALFQQSPSGHKLQNIIQNEEQEAYSGAVKNKSNKNYQTAKQLTMANQNQQRSNSMNRNYQKYLSKNQVEKRSRQQRRKNSGTSLQLPSCNTAQNMQIMANKKNQKNMHYSELNIQNNNLSYNEQHKKKEEANNSMQYPSLIIDQNHQSKYFNKSTFEKIQRDKLSRSISNIQRRHQIDRPSGSGLLKRREGLTKPLKGSQSGQYFSVKRQSYNSVMSVNQLYDKSGCGSQVIICKDQLSQSHSRKRNHQRIMDQIKLENQQQKNMSQRSIAGQSPRSQNLIQSKNNFGSEGLQQNSNQQNSKGPVVQNFHNHLSSVQNFEMISKQNMGSHSASQNQTINNKIMKSKSMIKGNNLIENFGRQSMDQLIQKNDGQNVNMFELRSKSAHLIERTSPDIVNTDKIQSNDLRFQTNQGSQQEIPQSTNTLSFLPNNLPDQIHQSSQLTTKLGTQNGAKLNQINEHDGGNVEFNQNLNTQNIQNLKILQTLQNSLLKTQGLKSNIYNVFKAPNGSVIDARNLRNYFIQSSLTFNGKNGNNLQGEHSDNNAMDTYRGGICQLSQDGCQQNEMKSGENEMVNESYSQNNDLYKQQIHKNSEELNLQEPREDLYEYLQEGVNAEGIANNDMMMQENCQYDPRQQNDGQQEDQIIQQNNGINDSQGGQQPYTSTQPREQQQIHSRSNGQTAVQQQMAQLLNTYQQQFQLSMGQQKVPRGFQMNDYSLNNASNCNNSLHMNMKMLQDQFKTLQQNHFLSKDSRDQSYLVHPLTNEDGNQNGAAGGGGGTTSGFLSGGMLAGLHGMLFDHHDNTLDEGLINRDGNLKVFSSKDESNQYVHRLHHPQPNQFFNADSSDSKANLQNLHKIHDNNHDQISATDQEQADLDPQGKSDLIEAGLQPDCIFDLPTALIELQKAFEIIHTLKLQLSNSEQTNQQQEIAAEQQKDQQQEKLGIEIIQLEQRNLNLEQQILELVEQRKISKEEIEKLNEMLVVRTQKYNQLKQSYQKMEEKMLSLQTQNDMNQQNVNSLNMQIQLLQQALNEKNQRFQEIEKHNNFLQDRDIQIQQTLQKLKSKYKQKLLEKQQNIDTLQISNIQLQKQRQEQFEQIDNLQRELEQIKETIRTDNNHQLPQAELNQHEVNLQMRHILQNENNMIGSFGNNNANAAQVDQPRQSIKEEANSPIEFHFEENMQYFSNEQSQGNSQQIQYNESQNSARHLQNQQEVNQYQYSQDNQENKEFGSQNLKLNQNSDVTGHSQASLSQKINSCINGNVSVANQNSNQSITQVSQANSQRSNQTNQLNQSTIQPQPGQQPQPINMHMQMNLSPMTKEIEKLREHLTLLINSMIQVQTEQKAELSRIHGLKDTGTSSKPFKAKSANETQQEKLNESEARIGERDEQIKLMQEVKQMLTFENEELRRSMSDYHGRAQSLQNHNDQLKLENAKFSQKVTQLKNNLIELQIKNQELTSNKQRDELGKVTVLQKKNKELEELIMRDKLDRYKNELNQKELLLEQTKKYDRQLRDMRAALGFAFCAVGMKKGDVPGYLSEKLIADINEIKVSSRELLNSLIFFEQTLQKLNTKRSNDLKPLKQQNKELLKLLNQEVFCRRQLMNQLQELRGNIRVLCRVRPAQSFETSRKNPNKGVLPLEYIGSDKIFTPGYLSNQSKIFNFDRVFAPNCSQSDIFDEVQGLIQSSMEGFNVCIMAFGQTGSGKTYTMVGDDENPGLYFSSVDEIFRNIKRNQGQIEYEIKVGVIEIYNEQIRDLLQKNQQRNEVKMMEGADGRLHADQLKRKVSNKNQILKALRDACYNRTVGVTQFNEYSSRSHFIMTIFISGLHLHTKQLYQGKLSLADLAGSERILKTNAEGIRIKEAQNINQSLATLGKVFLSLRNNSPHVPYRDSKLTHYLKDSIGGNAKTLMMLQISPLQKDQCDSLGTLTFGYRAQQIMKGNLQAQIMRSVSVAAKGRHRRQTSQSSFRQPKDSEKHNRSVSLIGAGSRKSSLRQKKSPKKRNSRSQMGYYKSGVNRSLNGSVMMTRNPLLTNSMVNITNDRYSVQKKRDNLYKDSKCLQRSRLLPPQQKGSKRSLSRSVIKYTHDASLNNKGKSMLKYFSVKPVRSIFDSQSRNLDPLLSRHSEINLNRSKSSRRCRSSSRRNDKKVTKQGPDKSSELAAHQHKPRLEAPSSYIKDPSNISNLAPESSPSNPANPYINNDNYSTENVHDTNYCPQVNDKTLQSSQQSLTASATSPTSPHTGETSNRAFVRSQRKNWASKQSQDRGHHKEKDHINIQEHLNFIPQVNQYRGATDTFNGRRQPIDILVGGVNYLSSSLGNGESNTFEAAPNVTQNKMGADCLMNQGPQASEIWLQDNKEATGNFSSHQQHILSTDNQKDSWLLAQNTQKYKNESSMPTNKTSKAQTRDLQNYQTEDQIVSSFKNSEINSQNIFESNLKKNDGSEIQIVLSKSGKRRSKGSKSPKMENHSNEPVVRKSTQYVQKMSLLEELVNVNKMIEDIDQKIEMVGGRRK